MGRVKEIFMQMREMCDNDIPYDFHFDNYPNTKSERIAAEREYKIDKILSELSECCDDNIESIISFDGSEYPGLDIV